MNIDVKRVYDEPGPEDGTRILVDRLWPRGVSKADAKIDLWLKSVAPSNDLRKWYHHDSGKWDEFRRRYFAELHDNQDAVNELAQHIAAGKVTLLYSSRERRYNNAVALRDFVTGDSSAPTRSRLLRNPK